MKKVIAYIIAAILIIAFNVLYLSRYFLGVYINYKRNDWETDRNFYAKNIKLDGIKLDKNGSKQFIYSSKKFKKEKANGNVFYYMKHKGNKIYASIKDYKKYVANSSSGKVIAKKTGKKKTVIITVMSTDGTNKKKTVKIKIK